MSLDFYLKNGEEVLFDRNITHNLNKMAEAAGIYYVLWRPEEIGVERADEVIPILREGLCRMVSDPKYYKQYNAPNGWGMYEHFIPFCTAVLEACMEHPNATVYACR